ncbi:GrdX family protein [Oceanirhabdus sp. W0125-5]|uniref:GrdX family protein n=1 Tax=Oceanirhabdus sp. W0125-5 TaxID=2999116 RepID=UPI0022F338BC|nr:GrdX family protein [Oceanirhabdus sp. W0125-5]WBW98799.1 GrdX family protein [Oceanirhabdus sp. W0125-5]
MIEKLIIVTNNPLSFKNFKKSHETIYIEGHVREVYKKVRDMIHLGHRLLTHPLMSSIKPNMTPYRTIVISYNKEARCDMESLTLIEGSIATLEKFLSIKPIPEHNEAVKYDFQVIDYDLINHALN